MNTTVVRTSEGLFEVELEGETVLVTPSGNLRELDFQEIEAGAKEVLAFVNQMQARNVVVDLHRMDYSGSTALGFFLQLSKAVGNRKGRMAFCCVSDHEKEILQVTHLGGMGPLCASREEAFAAVKE